MESDPFDALMAEADRRPFVGWDVTLDGRISSVRPWDFSAQVDRRARRSPDLLDIGTGGGEWLAALPHRPARTAAVEGWPPNVPVARRQLEPLGVAVFAVEPAAPNVEQTQEAAGGALPFEDASFQLVVSRHEAYLPREVRRVLAPGGRFVTQQVASGAADDFYRLFGAAAPQDPVAWTLAFAVRQLEDAGFVIEEAEEGAEIMTFADVGALAWYLKNVPFVYPEFSIPEARDQLLRLHREAHDKGIEVRQPSFRIEAVRP
jgi:SAM-dependent methyltransferase